MMAWNQLGFPDPATAHAGRLQCYHDTVMVVVVMVLILVLWFIIITVFTPFCLKGQLDHTKTKDNLVEILWTVTPAFFLSYLGFWSLVNLYYSNFGGEPMFSFKVVGHQWYWEYVYDFGGTMSNEEIETLGVECTNKIDALFENCKKLKNVFDLPSFSGPMGKLLENELRSKSLKDALVAVGYEAVPCEMVTDTTNVVLPIWDFTHDLMESFSKFGELAMNSEGEALSYKQLGKYAEFVKEISLALVNMKEITNSKAYSEVLLELIEKYKEYVLLADLLKTFDELDELITEWHWICTLKSIPKHLQYESYMVSEDDLVDKKSRFFGGYRNASVTNPCFMCCHVKNEVLVSTADVMHSWGVPELGLKIDAVPGRINSAMVTPLVPGVFYGFCYELCGAGHSEMPIMVVALELEHYLEVLESMYFEQVGMMKISSVSVPSSPESEALEEKLKEMTSLLSMFGNR